MKPEHIKRKEAVEVLSKINEELIYFEPIVDHDSFCNPSSFVNSYVLRQVNPLWPDKAEAEASAMKFADKIGLPVPKIYYYDAKYILMEKAKGTRLDKVWDELSLDEKRSYMKDMISIVESMQKHKSGFIGSLFGEKVGKCIDFQKGPYTSFKEFFLEDYNKRVNSIKHPLKKEFAKFRKKAEEELDFEVESVFCHSDLGLKNLFGEKGKITCIIDWEWSGFYPWIYDFQTLKEWCDYDLLKNSGLNKSYPTKLKDFNDLSSLAMQFAYYHEWNIKDEKKFVKELELKAKKLFQKIEEDK